MNDSDKYLGIFFRREVTRAPDGTVAEIINQSVTQTLSRTIMTSGTTMLVVVSLFLFGGATLHGFSLALIIGIAVGTYSSIFIASSLVILMGVSKTDLVVVEKEGAEVDSTP